MQRNLALLAEEAYDLLVIGAGIYGACITWEATLRGLSVALVEKKDFGHATSANSLKTIHGGLRYLQYADWKRMRESIREQATLMRIAPHLIHPLPCLVPTYGHSTRGRELMALALLLYDVAGFDRNRGIEPRRHLPWGRTVSRDECLLLLPGLTADGLSGGAIWYDCQMYNSERLTLSFILSAEQRGAAVANYVKATSFLRQGDRIVGIHARDELSGLSLEIRAKTVVNAAGPWVDRVLGELDDRYQLGIRLAKAINIATRPLFGNFAVGLYGKSNYLDEDAVLNRGARLIFVNPWRDQSLIGTTYMAYNGHPDHFEMSDNDVQELLDEINYAYPAAKLARSDVRFVYGGLVPISGVNALTGNVQRARRYQIYDHRQNGLAGLISVLGVKYTTARDVAEKVVDHVFATWGYKGSPALSSQVLLHGGDVGQLHDYVAGELAKRPCGLSKRHLRSLIYNYGTAYSNVLRYFEQRPVGQRPLSVEEALLQAETRHAVRHEMAQKLSDVVLRRTEVGTAGHPDPALLQLAAQVMGQELGWSHSRMIAEYQAVEEWFALTTYTQPKLSASEPHNKMAR
jgi:glycerol-3-phosphate dehydrogenase